MEKSILLSLLASMYFSTALCVGEINISTTSESTFEPKAAKSTEEEGSFLDAVENYLTEATNSKKSEPQNQLQGYVAHPMYPVYPPYNSGAYFYPGVNPNAVAETNKEVYGTNYLSAVLPATQMAFEIIRNLFLYYLVRHFVLKLIKIFDLILDIRAVLVTDDISHYLTKAALQAGFKLFAKLGLYLMGGAGLLVLGGIFTTILCYLTPICTVTFHGYDFQKALDKETMRSLMTPEKIASAAALVQDAIGKYQRLQRAVGQ